MRHTLARLIFRWRQKDGGRLQKMGLCLEIQVQYLIVLDDLGLIAVGVMLVIATFARTDLLARIRAVVLAPILVDGPGCLRCRDQRLGSHGTGLETGEYQRQQPQP